MENAGEPATTWFFGARIYMALQIRNPGAGEPVLDRYAPCSRQPFTNCSSCSEHGINASFCHLFSWRAHPSMRSWNMPFHV